MPKLGESVTEGTITSWLKSVGDTVEFDDPLVEVSTDKVDSEIPSPLSGVLAEITVAAGQTVPVGTVLARVTSVGAETSSASRPKDEPVAPAAGPPAAAVGNRAGRVLSPVVRRLAAEHGIDLTALTGSGLGGRIMREDVVAATLAAASAGQAVEARQAAAAAPTPTAAHATPTSAAPEAPKEDGDEVVPLSRIRLITAERMVQSKQISPHVWTSVEVDLERIEQARKRHKERFRRENGASLTYLPFIARAVCDGLRAFPTVNASVDMADKTMVLHKRIHLAIAVDLNEQGLMAPVIRDADRLNIRGLAQSIRAVAEGAKNKTLRSDDVSGSTFTLTNPGPLGSFASAPIINQPNVAIMSTEGVTRRPVAVGDAIAIHHTCVLGFSYDHRAFDGVTAARFLMFVRDVLQQRDWDSEVG
jgi:pyruvate dehydrogenase E2 component (dihydrolipoamide acetyltransferase)